MRPERDLYDDYLSTTYRHHNDVSPAALERAAADYGRQFGRFLPADPDAPILELGCGVGGFLDCCRQRGYRRVQGVDLSAEQVAFCRRRGFEQVEQADALEYLRDSADSFALIVMSDVLEHVPRPEVVPLLRAAARRLDPGGRLIVRVPNLSNPLNLRTRYVDFTHESGFTQESLAQVLRMAALEVETVEGLFSPHRRLLARWLFDELLWRLFRFLVRHTLHLKQEMVRGKNLLAVARRTDG